MKPLGHFARYGQAYLAGALFMGLQFFTAFMGQAKLITPAAAAAMGRFEWWQFWAGVMVGCIPTMLAFLNQSVARGAAALTGTYTVEEISDFLKSLPQEKLSAAVGFPMDPRSIYERQAVTAAKNPQ
jgi:hypothetical protein